ncbi:MAG TPA: hypothetical protein VHE61_24240 [Opitutaceae bacterium]|nr:hypothetical protein [Opitutaceae bacterium]
MKKLLAVLVSCFAAQFVQASTYSFSSTSFNAMSHGTAYTWGLQGTPYTNLLGSVQNSNMYVSSATLTIYNIYDWTSEPKDVLYVNLLSNVAAGAHSYTYSSNPSTYDTSFGTDPFSTTSPNYTNVQNHMQFDPAAAGSLLTFSGNSSDNVTNPGTWSDPHGGSSHNYNLVLTFSSANLDLLNQYLSSDSSRYSPNVGIGFGPDCHYYDSGVSLCITTSPNQPPPPPPSVPDTANTLGLTVGALGMLLGGSRLLRRRANRA